jgi:flavin reductase (DIM6/NTAB) family NADH-FMN oxidoreductase RutF
VPDPRTDRPSGVAGDVLAGALSRLAGGVVLLSTHDDEEGDAVITATSFTSVSLEPPLVLVGVAQGTWMQEMLDRTRRWAVSVLGDRQRSVAARFAAAQRPSPRVLLGGIAHHRAPLTGALVLDDALATLECRSEQHILAGDHVLVVGMVVAADASAVEHAPLVRFRQRYSRLATE